MTAAVVVIPTSYVLLVYSNPPLPAIRASSISKNIPWTGNFSNAGSDDMQFWIFNGSSGFLR